MMRKLIACILALTAIPAMAQETPEKGAEKEVIVPEAWQETYDEFQYAPAVRAGDMLYLSGVVVRLNKDETDADISAAVNRAFDQIDGILAEAGADWSDVVDVTSYHTSFDTHFGQMWAVKMERVAAPYPAWTAIGIERLYGGDNAIIEIKVTAYLPQQETAKD